MPNRLLDMVKQNPNGIIGRAYTFAEKAHKGQKRKTGEPYFVHLVATATTLLDWGADETTVAAGLLHDTIEDCGVTREQLELEFSSDVAFLVEGVTKLGKVKYRAEGNASDPPKNSSAHQESETRREVGSLRKLILAISQDIRVVLIKLADRLHNMKTLSALPPAKQKRIALETDEIYAPLAYRLGMHNISGELHDLAFPYLHPREWEWMKKNMGRHYEVHTKYLVNLKPQVESILRQHGILPVSIDFRAKRFYSLYKKLVAHNMDPEKIYDLVAMRIIVQKVEECYSALGVIHANWPPLPGRIKDYIAMPKPNGYRSLHTTVIGPENKIVEFQIRTEDMHKENEFGIASHWAYKEHKTSSETKRELEWVSQLKDWQERFAGAAEADPEGFLQAMKIDFFKDRIFVMTPRGEVIDLPAGSTPVDFAYHIHSEIGDSATAAKVNNTFVPLSHELKSGDMVEIITQKGKKPSEDWLQFVKSAAARDRIRASLRRSIGNIRLPDRIEFKITAQNRVGLFKEVSSVLARSHLNIHDLAVLHQTPSITMLKILVDGNDLAKAQKVAVKIKTEVPAVKEISVKLAAK